MEYAARMGLDEATSERPSTGKLVDLLSRINGGILEMPDLDLRTQERDRRIDKVCVAIALLKTRFGGELELVPRSLLRFIAHTQFRYGVRSIAHLMDIISSKAFKEGKLDIREGNLPLNSEITLQGSSLSLHLLDKDHGFGIVNRWNDYSKDNTMVSLEKKSIMFRWRNTIIARSPEFRGRRAPLRL
jgi:hypothetical protein